MSKSLLLVAIVVIQAITSTSAFAIDCRFNLTNNWIVIGRAYECYTTSLPSSPSDQTITDVSGAHLSGKTNNDVKMLHIYGSQSLGFVPRGVTALFPNLVAYYLRFTSFETLYGDEFDEIPQLQWLNIQNTQLQTISSRLFDATPNVKYVNFDSNKLQRVGSELFTHLNINQLEIVGFGSNPCIDEWAYSQSQVPALIEKLRAQCPLNDDDLLTTTTEVTSTVAPTTTELTTTERETCIEGSIEELKAEVSDLRANLASKSEEVEELRNANVRHEEAIAALKEEQASMSESIEKLQEVECKMWKIVKLLKEDLQKLETSPCGCK
jgi:hypothetical protein